MSDIQAMQLLTIEDGTFPALLKMLTDTSPEVIMQDLELLAQIALTSDSSYLWTLAMNLLDMFNADSNVLAAHGERIIRELCYYIGAERMYKIFAEILENDEVRIKSHLKRY